MTIAFTKVNLPYGWLGNMAPYPVVYEGKTYKTTEALFQALRFSFNPMIAQAIQEQKSPMAAKMVAKKHAKVLNDSGYVVMSETDIENMRLCLELKLTQHAKLQQWLLDTGNETIIEDCSSRPRGSGLFWGAALQNNVWVGKNVLGKLWEEKREQLNNQHFFKSLA